MTKIDAMINILRKEFGKYDRMSDSHYKRLVTILDKADNEAIVAAAKADIKFVSILAQARCRHRGLKY